MAASPFLEIVRKHATDAPWEPMTIMDYIPVPLPATRHTLEVVEQGATGLIGSRPNVWARFARTLPVEAWIAHRFFDDVSGKYRLEPVLTVALTAPDRATEEYRRAKVGRELQRAVADFNKRMRRAEDLAKGTEVSWWRRAWKAVH